MSISDGGMRWHAPSSIMSSSPRRRGASSGRVALRRFDDWIPGRAGMKWSGLSPLCAALLSVMLSGCSSTRHETVSAANEGWPLLSPASLAQARQVTQVLRGDYADHSFSLRSVVTVDAQQLAVIGVTSMGIRAFTLKYDGVNLSEERAPQVPDALQARQLLNDLQLAFWPLSALQQSWRAAGGELTEPYPGTRRLHRAGVLLAEVHYASDPWNGRVWLRHFDYPYSLFIESSPLEKGP